MWCIKEWSGEEREMEGNQKSISSTNMKQRRRWTWPGQMEELNRTWTRFKRGGEAAVISDISLRCTWRRWEGCQLSIDASDKPSLITKSCVHASKHIQYNKSLLFRHLSHLQPRCLCCYESFIGCFCTVSFTDDCLHRNVTSLTQNIGYLALYPRSSPVVKSNEPSSPTTQTRTCYWLLNVNPGRKIVISWARIFPGTIESISNW